jgi:hypothetical protein
MDLLLACELFRLQTIAIIMIPGILYIVLYEAVLLSVESLKILSYCDIVSS